MVADFVALAGTLWRYWDNPFLLRSMRSMWRGRSWRAALWAQFGILCLIVLLGGLAPSIAGPAGFPPWLGGSWGGMTLAALALAHFFMVMHGASSARRGELLTDEARRGSLEGLLVTPMSRAEIILKATVYPFLRTSLTAWLALPLYLLCASFGDVPVSTVGALYVLVTLLAFQPPVRLRHSILAHSRTQQVVGLLAGSTALVWLLGAQRGGVNQVLHSGGLLLSWVWELADWLGRPAPWFAIRVPPVVLLLALYPLHMVSGILMASSEMEEDPRRTHRSLAQFRFHERLLLGVAGLGLIWRPLVLERDLAGSLAMPEGPAGALAWLIAGGVTLVAGFEVLETARTRLDLWAGFGGKLRFGRSAAAHVASGVVQSCSAMLLVPVLYVLACALCAVSPFDAWGRLLACLLVGLASVALCYAMGLLLWLLVVRRRWLFASAFLLMLGCLIAAPWAGLSVASGAGSFIAGLSPLGSLAAVTGRGGSWFVGAAQELPAWHVCAGLQALAALLLLALDASVLHQRMAARGRMPASQRAAVTVTAPAGPERCGRWERSLIERDNPLALQGWRAARRSGAALAAPTLAGLAILLSLALASSRALPPGLAPTLLRSDAMRTDPTAWSILALLGGGLSVIGPLAAGIAGGSSFVEDRRRHTFGFVLLTPLTEADILNGRLLALAWPQLAAVALCALPLAGAALMAGSLAAVAQLAHSLVWSVLAGAATCYAGMSGALTPRASSAGGGGRAIMLWLLLEAARWVVVGIARTSQNGLSASGQGVVALVAALLLTAVAAVALGLSNALARSTLGSLRRSDMFRV